MKNKTILKSVFPMLFEEKRKRAAYILSCAAFTLTLFFFMPFDLYLNNYNDFNVSISNVLLPLATVSLIVFLITAVINPVLFREFKKIVLEMILLLMLGVALACYIQVLLFNSDMVNLNGNTANYGDITFKRTVNFVLWCLIVILPFVAHILLKKKKKCLFPIITGISIVMIGMQAVGLIPALSKYDGKSVGGECFFSYNKTLELSSKENICVFIVDRLDVKFMNEALDNFPELYEMLDGFTYYENNLSTDTNTFPAVTRMLTNEVYEYDDTFAEYWDKAWSNYGVIDELRDNGYGSTMLIDKVSTFGTEEQIFDKSDNMMNLRDSEI
ncbi:MAG: hypothetical protein FWF94_04180 [Oscillospiraceae bacterium]|nr:hypothetical protein [Oscillospiraceae bacterium]